MISHAEVQAIHSSELAKRGDAADALRATRTIVHGMLQDKKPAPAMGDPDPGGHTVQIGHLAGAPHGRHDHPALHAKLQPDAHHVHQAQHMQNLWQETDALIAAAGVK